LASIQASAGEHLLRARCIIFKDLESKESLRSELNDALADELCEAMSRYCRTPAVRFFNSLLILKKSPFSRPQNAQDPKRLRIFLGRMHSIMPWSRILFLGSSHAARESTIGEDTATEMIRCIIRMLASRQGRMMLRFMSCLETGSYDPWLYATR
jgi:hypothetical protein